MEANSSELFLLLLVLSRHCGASAKTTAATFQAVRLWDISKNMNYTAVFTQLMGNKEYLCELLCVSSYQHSDNVLQMWDCLGKS